MKFSKIGTVLFLVACEKRIPQPRPVSLECETQVASLSEANWNGPTEADVLAAAATFVPTHIVWDEFTMGETESVLVLDGARSTEEARIEVRTMSGGSGGDPLCRPGPELVLPMTFAVDVSAGGVIGAVPGTLAIGLNDPTVFVDVLGPVALDGEWSDQALSSFDEGNPTDVIEWFFVIVQQPWGADTLVGVESIGYDGHDDAALWRGHLAD